MGNYLGIFFQNISWSLFFPLNIWTKLDGLGSIIIHKYCILFSVTNFSSYLLLFLFF